MVRDSRGRVSTGKGLVGRGSRGRGSSGKGSRGTGSRDRGRWGGGSRRHCRRGQYCSCAGTASGTDTPAPRRPPSSATKERFFYTFRKICSVCSSYPKSEGIGKFVFPCIILVVCRAVVVSCPKSRVNNPTCVHYL